MRRKGIQKVLVRSVMSLYEGASTRFGMESELSEEFEAEVQIHQGSMLSPLLLAVVLHVVTDLAGGCVN